MSNGPLMRKLRGSSGASMMLALLFLLFCLTVGSICLTAASANAGRLARNRETQQSYLAVESAALLLRDDFADLTLTGDYRYLYTTTYSYTPTGEKDEEGNDILQVEISSSSWYEDGSAALTGSDLTSPLSDPFTQLFHSTHPPHTVTTPDPFGATFTLQAGKGLPDVKGTLTVSTAQADRYAITVTLSTADGAYPMTLRFTPVVSSPAASTTGSRDNYTTTYTQTVTWQAAEITKGGTP